MRLRRKRQILHEIFGIESGWIGGGWLLSKGRPTVLKLWISRFFIHMRKIINIQRRRAAACGWSDSNRRSNGGDGNGFGWLSLQVQYLSFFPWETVTTEMSVATGRLIDGRSQVQLSKENDLLLSIISIIKSILTWQSCRASDRNSCAQSTTVPFAIWSRCHNRIR